MNLEHAQTAMKIILHAGDAREKTMDALKALDTFDIENAKELLNKVRVFQTQYRKGHLPPKVKERCCDFSLLEVKCREYIEKVIENDIEAINLAKDDIDLII